MYLYFLIFNLITYNILVYSNELGENAIVIPENTTIYSVPENMSVVIVPSNLSIIVVPKDNVKIITNISNIDNFVNTFQFKRNIMIKHALSNWSPKCLTEMSNSIKLQDCVLNNNFQVFKIDGYSKTKLEINNRCLTCFQDAYATTVSCDESENLKFDIVKSRYQNYEIKSYNNKCLQKQQDNIMCTKCGGNIFENDNLWNFFEG